MTKGLNSALNAPSQLTNDLDKYYDMDLDQNYKNPIMDLVFGCFFQII